MVNTTLCYMEEDGKLLMLYRNKKKNDLNAGKWVGIGGKFEKGETAEECLYREIYEETGLKPLSYKYLGVIEFRNDAWEDEDMYLYSAVTDALEKYTACDKLILPGTSEPVCGIIPNIDCNEGTLAFVYKKDILKLNLWEGDRYFLKPMLEGADRINLRLMYHGDELTEVITRD